MRIKVWVNKFGLHTPLVGLKVHTSITIGIILRSQLTNFNIVLFWRYGLLCKMLLFCLIFNLSFIFQIFFKLSFIKFEFDSMLVFLFLMSWSDISPSKRNFSIRIIPVVNPYMWSAERLETKKLNILFICVSDEISGEHAHSSVKRVTYIISDLWSRIICSLLPPVACKNYSQYKWWPCIIQFLSMVNNQ